MADERDALTGLPARAGLKQAVEQSIKAGEGAAVAVLDIDHFTEVNDTLGHAGGDSVLKTLGAIVEEAAPGRAYRVSGDELAILMPGATLEAAFLQMEALRRVVEASQERFNMPEGRKLTVTIGVAQCPRDAKDEPGLMRAADAALMAAKEGGRNQVALPPNEEMVMKSCYYSTGSIRKLKALAERLKKKESVLLREALNDLLRRYDQP